MDGEEDRTKPPQLSPDAPAAEESHAVADPRPREQTLTAMTSAEAAASEEFTASSGSASQEPIGSSSGVDPTPEGPTEPTHNVEIELPPGWNGNRVTPSEPPESASPPPSAPTEPSRHVQVEVPPDWDGTDLEPSERSGDMLGAPSAPIRRPAAPTPSSTSRSGQSDRERRVPSIVVTVSLGHSRDMFEQAVEAAIQSATQKFHKIVKQEIDLFAFEQRAARRAADYRLRGPNPQ